jgi:tetratricopeptide (TPR) repeat protein
MITRDAEPLLIDTLDTASQLADEIVVCDTGSKDASRELARQHGAKLIEHSWSNSFAEARNAAWEAATGDWILWLDAGERLTVSDAQALRNFVDSQADSNCAYMMLVAVPPAPHNISGEQVGRIRLLPNRKDLRFRGRVREFLKPAIARSGLRVEGLPWRIARSESDNDPQVRLSKAIRDLKLLELEGQQSGQTAELLVAKGEAMIVAGDVSGAIACLRLALHGSDRGAPVQREAYYGLLTALDANPEERPQQIATCLEALERFPLDAQLLCAMGGYMQAEGRIEMAVRAYQMAFEHGQVDPEIWHVPDIFEIAAACLCLAQQLQNNDEGAQQALEQGLARDASAVRLRRQLIDLHVKHDRRKEALAEFDLLPAETPNREALRSAIRGACLASRQNWTPALAYLQTAYRAGCRDLLCLRWLSIALSSSGDTEGAREVLATWQALDPRSGEVDRYLAALEMGCASDSGRQLRYDVGASGHNLAPPPKLGSAATINLFGPTSSR